MIGCDVLEPDPSYRPKRNPATAEDVQLCIENLQSWYMEAIDRKIEAAARAAGLSKRQIALLLHRASA